MILLTLTDPKLPAFREFNINDSGKIYALSNSYLTMTCNVSGVPKPTISWFKVVHSI